MQQKMPIKIVILVNWNFSFCTKNKTIENLDFVFICHDQKVNKQRPEISAPSPRSHSALQYSSASSSSSTDHDDVNLFKQNPYPLKSKPNSNNNNYERTQIVTTPSTTNEKTSSHEDIDIDELFRTDKSLPSIVFFPSSSKKQ